jgi:hypothetical protein
VLTAHNYSRAKRYLDDLLGWKGAVILAVRAPL